MRYSLLTQVVFITISLVIMFTFIKPMFSEIKNLQDQEFIYSDAVAKAAQFNSRLQELIELRDSISRSDLAVLENFLPLEIDSLKVMNDIESVFRLKNIPITALTATDIVEPASDVSFETDVVLESAQAGSKYQDFEVAFNSSYEEMKELLSLLEMNAALLEVVELTFEAQNPSDATVQEDDALPEGVSTYVLKLRAYGLQMSSQ